MEDSKYKFEDGKFINRFSGEAIPDDEPVIIFRARDSHVVTMLENYMDDCSDSHHANVMLEVVDQFRRFRSEHPERMREPLSRNFPLGVGPK